MGLSSEFSFPAVRRSRSKLPFFRRIGGEQQRGPEAGAALRRKKRSPIPAQNPVQRSGVLLVGCGNSRLRGTVVRRKSGFLPNELTVRTPRPLCYERTAWLYPRVLSDIVYGPSYAAMLPSQ